MNHSPQCGALHKATICPNAVCAFSSIRMQDESVVIFHLIPLAQLVVVLLSDNTAKGKFLHDLCCWLRFGSNIHTIWKGGRE